VLALALLAAPGCAAARPGAAAAATAPTRPLARLLLQQQEGPMLLMMNRTAARVNASIAASNATSSNVTRIANVQLRKCQWDMPGKSCQLNGAFSLSTDIPDPSEYGGWVLAGQD
jgi:hypothetical protein